jgi:hypothetical protein
MLVMAVSYSVIEPTRRFWLHSIYLMKPQPETLFVTSRFALLRLRVRDWWLERVGRMLERLHSPAKIREFEYVDPDTNEIVYLSTGARYSVLHVGNKQLFFSRITGRFDGTGTLLELRIGERHVLLD